MSLSVPDVGYSRNAIRVHYIGYLNFIWTIYKQCGANNELYKLIQMIREKTSSVINKCFVKHCHLLIWKKVFSHFCTFYHNTRPVDKQRPVRVSHVAFPAIFCEIYFSMSYIEIGWEIKSQNYLLYKAVFVNFTF